MSTNSPNITIEPARMLDAPAILSIQVEGWLDAFPDQEVGITKVDLRAHLLGDHGERASEKLAHWEKLISTAKVFVAKEEGEVVGWVSPYERDGKCMLGGMYITKKARGTGIASLLLAAVIRWYGPQHDIYLEVLAHNRYARSVYEHLGFEEVVGSKLSFQLRNGKRMPEIEMVKRATSKTK